MCGCNSAPGHDRSLCDCPCHRTRPLAVHSLTATTEVRPTHRDPDAFTPDPSYPLDEQEGAYVGWDIGFWCRITFSEDPDGMRVTVSQRNDIDKRGVTREQVLDFAHKLIVLATRTEVPA